MSEELISIDDDNYEDYFNIETDTGNNNEIKIVSVKKKDKDKIIQIDLSVIKEIGNKAFKECESLENVYFPNVTKIGCRIF